MLRTYVLTLSTLFFLNLFLILFYFVKFNYLSELVLCSAAMSSVDGPKRVILPSKVEVKSGKIPNCPVTFCSDGSYGGEVEVRWTGSCVSLRSLR